MEWCLQNESSYLNALKWMENKCIAPSPRQPILQQHPIHCTFISAVQSNLPHRLPATCFGRPYSWGLISFFYKSPSVAGHLWMSTTGHLFVSKSYQMTCMAGHCSIHTFVYLMANCDDATIAIRVMNMSAFSRCLLEAVSQLILTVVFKQLKLHNYCLKASVWTPEQWLSTQKSMHLNL